MTEIINKILALATVLADIFLILAILYFWFTKGTDKIKSFFEKNGLLLAWLVALSSTILSLYYSEIVGFPPCSLCWWQRIFIYPQAIILGMAYFKKDFKIVSYDLALSVVGAVIAFYQNYIYYGGTQFLACDSSPTAISCTKLYIFEFGYVTIPVMSLTAFLLMILFLKLQKKA
ncbi:MAG: disulfide bond formation protein B [Candidatus Magasanikbacteria bacterium]